MSRYIDANALIEAIKNELWDWKTLDDITATSVLKQTITDIQNQPTADVRENVHARWIRHGIGHKNVPWGFDCSACGEWYVIDKSRLGEYLFCPNCGAVMDEVRR